MRKLASAPKLRILLGVLAILLVVGCTPPEEKLIGNWKGSGMMVMPPTGNAKVDAQFAKIHTQLDYSLTLNKDKSYAEQVGRHAIAGTWKLDGQNLTLTPKTVDGRDPLAVRKEAEQNNFSIQLSIPLPTGSDGPELLIVAQDFKSIAVPSVGMTVTMKKG